MPQKGTSIRTMLLAGGAVVVAAGLILALGPGKLLAKSESPEFCASCHVMEAEYEAWFHQGAHRRRQCVECHLPGDNLPNHYLWKAIDGMKDVVMFHSGRVPEDIRLSGHGKTVVQANCVRCHESMVDRIDQGRTCWDCHRRLSHKRTGEVAAQ